MIDIRDTDYYKEITFSRDSYVKNCFPGKINM